MEEEDGAEVQRQLVLQASAGDEAATQSSTSPSECAPDQLALVRPLLSLLSQCGDGELQPPQPPGGHDSNRRLEREAQRCLASCRALAAAAGVTHWMHGSARAMGNQGNVLAPETRDRQGYSSGGAEAASRLTAAQVEGVKRWRQQWR